jgi:light-regulated signal transduction histidine kinase (bacteriophytochrome)
VLKGNPAKLAPRARRGWRENEARTKLKLMEQALRDNEDRFRGTIENLNQELETFSYSVSHDLRAPLRHILGYLDILQTTPTRTMDEASRKHLQTITQAAARMGQMIDALLEYSRIGRGKACFQPMNLATLVEEGRRELSAEIKGRQIDWQIHDLPEVQGDPVLLRKAITTLLNNAIKYTRTRRQARIEIGAKDSVRETIFFVRDNGVGFDINCAARLFGVFQRLHPASDFEGIGIGLANVRRIIHQHGGRAWGEGKVDDGATFYFSIPKPAKKAI